MSEITSSYLPVSVKASIEAGLAILEVYDGDHQIELKNDNSPLTIADRKSHNVIYKHLFSTSLPILSEEGKTISFEERKEWEQFWLVDPLDGTKEFIKRNGEFTVNIALIKNGVPILGIIYLPDGDKLYFGSIETGSYLLNNAKQILNDRSSGTQFADNLIAKSQKLPINSGKQNYTVVASRSHLSPETEELVSKLKAEHGELAFISKGSSIKICLVAEGTADIYPRLAPTMEWDTAAGQAIASFADCTVTIHPTKEPVRYNKENLLNPFFIVQRKFTSNGDDQKNKG